MAKNRLGWILALLGIAPVAGPAQQPLSSRSDAVKAVIERGDRSLTKGQQREAGAAWSLLLAFDPTNAVVKKKLSDIGGATISLDSSEMKQMMSLLGKLDLSVDACGFGSASPGADLANLRMLADEALLPSLRVTQMTPQSGPCSGKSVFIFLAPPGRKLPEIKAKFGAPSKETAADGGGARLDYGRFRLLAGGDGTVSAILFPALQ